jgi:hypothetical protein
MAGRKRPIAASDSIRVSVKAPAAVQPVSRGFYQVEEDILYVPVVPGGKFYSFLDSDGIVLDIDRSGRLLFIQIRIPRHQWHTRKSLRPPAAYTTADVRFLNFRDTLPPVLIETNARTSILRLTFAAEKSSAAFAIADNLLIETTAAQTLKSIWILSLDDDRAAQGMAAWRKAVGKEMKHRQDTRDTVRIEIRK